MNEESGFFDGPRTTQLRENLVINRGVLTE